GRVRHTIAVAIRVAGIADAIGVGVGNDGASQASPRPSPSLSAWSRLATYGQSSWALAIPSPSLSATAAVSSRATQSVPLLQAVSPIAQTSNTEIARFDFIRGPLILLIVSALGARTFRPRLQMCK